MVGVTHLLFVAAIIAAVTAVMLRRRRRRGLQAAARRRPGASIDRAIHIRSFADMDAHLTRRWCHCGGYLARRGEGSREADGRRFRVARLECQECEEISEVFFDTTDLLH